MDRSCRSGSTSSRSQRISQTKMSSNANNTLLGWTFYARLAFMLIITLSMGNSDLFDYHENRPNHLLANAHIVLTRDDRGQNLILTEEDGGGGKGKGGGGGNQLVIAGDNMGNGGQNSNMVMEDASNREGDVVINGNSMIVPGEDGHIVLADSRDRQGGGGGNGPRPPMQNLFAFWMPYMNSRMAYRMMPFFGGQFV